MLLEQSVLAFGTSERAMIVLVLTFLENISEVSHFLHGIVGKRIGPAGEDLSSQLIPDSLVPSEHKEGKTDKPSRCIARSEKHVNDLVTQYNGILCVFSKFVDKDVSPLCFFA